MSKKVITKKYYRIAFNISSPLALGSGDNDSTDKDLIRDACGNPYIPASSVAGVIRECLSRKDEKKVKNYLGYVEKNTRDTMADQAGSKVIFYDAVITNGIPKISVRDSVALDDFKIAKKGAKFDMEVLEPGVTFTTYIEQDITSEYEDDYGREIAGVFLAGQPVFGGKSTRGYGTIAKESVSVEEKTFDMQNSTDIRNWLSFNIYDDVTAWDKSEIDIADTDIKQLRLRLKQHGGISIRRYTTRVAAEGTVEPDMEQLTVGDDIPVIPGSSWAGAIAHRMKEFGTNTEEKDSIFGYVKGEGKDAKSISRITFGESVLSGGYFKTLSRNAIDRFTGGTVQGALFTERTYYGGSCDLVIEWRADDAMPEKEQQDLAAALTDIHFGFLAVGGETAIGRGIFSIESISIKGGKAMSVVSENGKDVYQQILKAIEEAFK